MRHETLAYTAFENYNVPKLWIERIPQYWDRRDPDPSTYPTTSTAFSVKFKNEEDKNAVKEMETGLNTEESILKDIDIPQGKKIGGYLGTYDVDGVVGESVLIFPEKVPSNATGVIAFHYTSELIEDESSNSGDEGEPIEDQGEEIIDDADGESIEDEIVAPGGVKSETKSWVKIEDAHIEDGYVYGTVDSFSPIAVFFVKRAPYFLSSLTLNKEAFGSTYVCNGDTTIVKQDGAKFYVTNGDGETTEYPSAIRTIIAGTIDGTDLEATNLTLKKVIRQCTVIGSSVVPDNETVVRVKEVNLSIDGSSKSIAFRTVKPNNKVETLNIDVKNSTLNYLGAGESIQKNGSVDTNGNSDADLNLASPSRVNTLNLSIDNSTIGILYGGGINGRFYVANSNVTVDNSKLGPYVCAGGSNGKTGKAVWKVTNSTLTQFESTNRGIVESIDATFENCDLDNFYVAGDSRESDVTGTISKARYKFVDGSLVIGRGSNGAVKLTKEDIKKIVERIVCTVGTDLQYIEDEDKILDILVSVRK